MKLLRLMIAATALMLLSATLLAQNPPPSQQPPPAPSKSQQHGKLFPPQDLGLLDPPDRETWQKTDQVMDALGVADGSIVADFGAGSGFFTVRLARRVGPNGMVYAQDVQFEMLNAISRRVQREGLTNVQPVLGQGNNPNFPPRAKGKLDAILMAGVYHEIDDPVTLLKNLAAAVQPQGRIGIVDFKAQGGGPGPSPEERVDPQVVIADAGSAGLRLVSHETFLPYQYLLIFTRAADPTTSKRPEARR